jgi:hypothetical protein
MDLERCPDELIEKKNVKEYEGTTIGEKILNKNNSVRLEESVTRPPIHFKAMIVCHGSYRVPRTQDKELINQLKEKNETDYHSIRGREQKYFHPSLNAIKFYVSSSNTLGVTIPENTEILRKTGIPFHKSEKQFKMNYQEEDPATYKHMNREIVKTIARLFCNDRLETIITHRPTVPGKMWLRPIELNFNPINPEDIHATNICKEIFGLWVCSTENIPEKVKGWEDRDIKSNNYTHTLEDVIRLSTKAVVNKGLRNGDTYEICIMACRPEPNLERTRMPMVFVNSNDPNSKKNHYETFRGGRERQPSKKMLVQIKEDIKKEEYEQFNEKGFAQVTEDQFEYFLEGNSIPEVIEHLTDENVAESMSTIEMSKIHQQHSRKARQPSRLRRRQSRQTITTVNNGGNKTRKILHLWTFKTPTKLSSYKYNKKYFCNLRSYV